MDNYSETAGACKLIFKSYTIEDDKVHGARLTTHESLKDRVTAAFGPGKYNGFF
jgi:hypothetical protein